MKTYGFCLKHDNGTVRIYIQDDSLESAKKRVLEKEKAPERAIDFWWIVPTAKQLKKTKNLMRNL